MFCVEPDGVTSGENGFEDSAGAVSVGIVVLENGADVEIKVPESGDGRIELMDAPSGRLVIEEGICEEVCVGFDG